MAQAIHNMVEVAKSYASEIGESYTLEKYLNYGLYMSAEDYWQSSSAEC